jgi:hypothetical protein
MARNNHFDITMELCELSEELITKIRAQINYYKVSVYKNESRSIIDNHIKGLKFISKVLSSDELKDLFEDFHAEENIYSSNPNSDYCPLTLRVSRLLNSFTVHIQQIKQNSYHLKPSKYDLKKSVIKFKNELIAICPHDSRSRSFFQVF